MLDLIELGKHHGTDKVGHDYLRHYDFRFGGLRQRPIKLLEIGVMKGASLRMWRDYFRCGQIYGLDIDPSTMFEEDRIKTFCGAQGDPELLNQILVETGPLDIVIDDGSHRGEDHVASFEALWPHLKDDGWYAIEDCQSIYNRCWTLPRDPTIMKELSSRWRQIITGRDTIREVAIIGNFIYSGLILMRKDALRADLVDYPEEPFES